MARKKGYDYFGAMEHLAKDTVRASQILHEIINEYDLDTLAQKSEEIHNIERESDEVVKEVMKELYVSFITPLDREDIVQIIDRLDDIMDGINGLTYEFYYLNVQQMAPNAVQFFELITQAVAAVQEAIKEFPHFKSSKTLMSRIEEANKIESRGDHLYTEDLAQLFRTEKDPIDVVRWQKIFFSFESVLDSCEDAADIIMGLIIKNS